MVITSEFSNLHNLTQLRTDCTFSLGSTSWQSNSWNIRLFCSFLVRRSIDAPSSVTVILSLLVSEAFLALATKYGTENLERRITLIVSDKSKFAVKCEMFMTTKQRLVFIYLNDIKDSWAVENIYTTVYAPQYMHNNICTQIYAPQ
jgi:hypothetical protein